MFVQDADWLVEVELVGLGPVELVGLGPVELGFEAAALVDEAVDVIVLVTVPETDQAIIQNTERTNPISVFRETLILCVNFIVAVDKGENSKNTKKPIATIN